VPGVGGRVYSRGALREQPAQQVSIRGEEFSEVFLSGDCRRPADRRICRTNGAEQGHVHGADGAPVNTIQRGTPRVGGAQEPQVALERVRMGLREAGWSFGRCRAASRAGEFPSSSGPAAAGRARFLRLIGGLVRPQAGSVRVMGRRSAAFGKRAALGSAQAGMLFQGGALLDSSTVFDNVALPLRELTRLSAKEIPTKSTRVWRGGRQRCRRAAAGELSGDVAPGGLARAIIRKPVICVRRAVLGLDRSRATDRKPC